MSEQDKNQLGLTEDAREKADAVVAAAGFEERQDVYRLAVAVALSRGLAPAPDGLSRRTYINVGSLDPDGAIRAAILETRDDHGGRPYALAERLAEAGIEDLHAHFNAGRSVREYLRAFSSA
jgi:hypothetical protein